MPKKDSAPKKLPDVTAIIKILENAYPIETFSIWALKTLFGSALSELGDGLGRFVKINIENLLTKYQRKTGNPQDDKQVNFRVASKIIRDAAYVSEEVVSEYLSSILASSRSKDGQDDRMVYYLDIVNSLSSHQLRLHYMIYRALNELLVENEKTELNLSSLGSEGPVLYADAATVGYRGIDLSRDLVALENKGLIGGYAAKPKKIKQSQYIDLKVHPTTLGFQLYGVACNRFSDWQKATSELFAYLPGIEKFNCRLLNESYVEKQIKAAKS